MSLQAHTVALEEPTDLVREAGEGGRLWSSSDGGIVGLGVAARLELPNGLGDPEALSRLQTALESIDTVDEVGLPGTGPVAIGSLPFDPNVAGCLVVPRRIVGRMGDIAWVTTVAGDGHGMAPIDSGSPPGLPPDHFTLASSMPHDAWKEVVADAVEEIHHGHLRKVVLARRVDITGNRPFVVSDVLERLAALYPSCMLYSIDGFVGASPELLVRRHGDAVDSHPLAGTVARSGDARGDAALVAALMSSPKARHEHRVVVDTVAAALGPMCRDLTVPDEPSVLGLRNVSHLATHISGRLRLHLPLPSALELVALLHPTPAVGGSPADAAIEYVQKVEGFDRGFYAGPVGWVDARGDGAWALGIRCAELSGARARIYAGNGIVDGSDPGEELAETQLKLQALLAALVRP